MDDLEGPVSIVAVRGYDGTPFEGPFRFAIELPETVVFFICRERFFNDVPETGVEARWKAQIEFFVSVADQNFSLSPRYFEFEYEKIPIAAGLEENVNTIFGVDPCKRTVFEAGSPFQALEPAFHRGYFAKE